MHWVVKFLVVTSLCYLGLVTAMFLFQRRLQYFPSQDLAPPAAYGAEMFKVVEITTNDGLRLTAWHAEAKKDAGQAGRKRPTIVLYHGNAGHIGHRLGNVAHFVAAGYGVFLTEYRGFGGNPGSPSEAGLFADGRAAIKHLQGRGLALKDLVLVGESLGTGVATRMAVEFPVRALLLESPFSSAVDVGQANYLFIPVRLLLWDRFESAAIIAKIKAPLLITHGDRDPVVPLRFGRRLFDAAVDPKTFHVVRGAGHGDLHRRGVGAVQLEFLRALE